MTTKKSNEGTYIRYIGDLHSQDQYLLDLLIEQGFILEKVERKVSKYYQIDDAKPIIYYRMYTKEDID